MLTNSASDIIILHNWLIDHVLGLEIGLPLDLRYEHRRAALNVSFILFSKNCERALRFIHARSWCLQGIWLDEALFCGPEYTLLAPRFAVK